MSRYSSHFPSYQHYHIVPSILLCKILMFYMYFMVKKASATHRPKSSPPRGGGEGWWLKLVERWYQAVNWFVMRMCYIQYVLDTSIKYVSSFSLCHAFLNSTLWYLCFRCASKRHKRRRRNYKYFFLLLFYTSIDCAFIVFSMVPSVRPIKLLSRSWEKINLPKSEAWNLDKFGLLAVPSSSSLFVITLHHSLSSSSSSLIIIIIIITLKDPPCPRLLAN